MAPPWQDLWVADTRTIGGHYRGAGLPFELTHSGDPESADIEPRNLDRVRDTFGFRPEAALDLDALTDSAAAHRILGDLTLHLARTLTGVVDLGGPLPVADQGVAVRTASWEDAEPLISRRVATAPGRLLTLPYTTARGRSWASQMCDAEFLGWWLGQPDFSLVK